MEEILLNLDPAVSRNYQGDVIQSFTNDQRGLVWCLGMERSLSLKMSPLPQGFRSPPEHRSSHGGDLPGFPTAAVADGDRFAGGHQHKYRGNC